MQAPRRGNGADFNPAAPYRMYHGDRIPGFPQHPHRGFETITATTQGIIDHTDSCGNAGRYGNGDLQWMTAGKGVVHGEMFPLVQQDRPNPLTLFQIWLNLPKVSKMVEPAFAMHWAEEVPTYTAEDGKARLTIWAGSYRNQKALDPPPNSWATNPSAHIGVYLLTLQPGGKLTLPGVAPTSQMINRAAYFIEGTHLQVNSESVPPSSSATLRASQDAEFMNNSETEGADSQVLILQGAPIGEPVSQQGPFVMNTVGEIQEAFADYRRTQFGGWPWPQDAMVFPREQGRFALQQGVQTTPPVSSAQQHYSGK